MRLFLSIAFLLFSIVVLAAVGIASVNSNGPSEQDLRSDIARIDAEIAAAQELGSKYAETSPLRVLIDLRTSVLATTRAMLDQKRLSWIRGIQLSYTVDGKRVPLLSAGDIAAFENDLSRIQTEAEAARAKAAGYTGGLVQVMALIEEQTHRVTAAASQLRFAMARIGIAMPGSPSGAPRASPQTPLWRTIDDKGAL